jgi:hypothetical protein
MITKTVTTSGGFLVDHDELIRFLGVGDRLSFSYLAGYDTVLAEGTNQTLVFVRSNNNTIHDNGHGLKLEFAQPSLRDVVYGLQNDRTGTVIFAVPVTLSPDGHGGTMASTLGLSVDFVGMSAAQLQTHMRPATQWT